MTAEAGKKLWTAKNSDERRAQFMFIVDRARRVVLQRKSNY